MGLDNVFCSNLDGEYYITDEAGKELIENDLGGYVTLSELGKDENNPNGQYYCSFRGKGWNKFFIDNFEKSLYDDLDSNQIFKLVGIMNKFKEEYLSNIDEKYLNAYTDYHFEQYLEKIGCENYRSPSYILNIIKLFNIMSRHNMSLYASY